MILGYDITAKIVEAFRVLTEMELWPNYGQDVLDAEKAIQAQNDCKIFLSVSRVLPQSKLMISTSGTIQEGDAIVTVIGRTAYNTVKRYQEFFDFVYSTGEGQGPQGQSFMAGTMQVWAFRPVGGLSREAVPIDGNRYGIQQLVYFAVKV